MTESNYPPFTLTCSIQRQPKEGKKIYEILKSQISENSLIKTYFIINNEKYTIPCFNKVSIVGPITGSVDEFPKTGVSSATSSNHGGILMSLFFFELCS